MESVTKWLELWPEGDVEAMERVTALFTAIYASLPPITDEGI